MAPGLSGAAARVPQVTSLSLRNAAATSTRTDVLVIGAVAIDDGVRAVGPGAGVAAAMGRRFAPTLSTLGFSAKSGEVVTLPSDAGVKSPLLLVVGLGKHSDELSSETLRRAAGVAVRSLHNAASVAVALPADEPEQLRAVCEGLVLGGYRFDTYRTKPASDAPAEVVVLTALARAKQGRTALERAQLVGGEVARARDWVNTPPRDLVPATFADQIAAAARDAKVDVRVWDEGQLAEERCGGILGVGQGSQSPPRLVQLLYAPRKAVAHVALVGKGITYDSGGITLKPAAGLTTMKCDMGGAAAVVAATLAIARLGLPVRVSAYAALAENMPSGTATRPGDVLRMRNGTTVEVLNTDAEGRLVLADALVLADEANPDLLIDVATLTGAAMVALGTRTAALITEDRALGDALHGAGDRAGDPLWPLPIPEEMRAKVRSSHIADLRQHNPDTSGGALFAAAFLREFVGERRWAHLDVAGPAFNAGEPFGYTPRGGTGTGVRALVRLAEDLADGVTV